MSILFESTRIHNLALRNRFVRSAVWEGMAADDGRATSKLINKIAELALNDVGLIITGHAYVSLAGQAGPWQLGAYSDDMLPGLQRMADTVHHAGGKIFLQLAHAGAHAFTSLTKTQAVGPSPIAGRSGEVCREMTRDEIRKVVSDLTDAAVRAQKSGFDGVQIHAAHGYLLSQFLSPRTNQRTDDFGGSIENRVRIVVAAIQSIRSAVGAAYPVIIKINSEDFTEGGFDTDGMIKSAAILEKTELDAIEMSGGTIVNPEKTHCARTEHPKTADREVYYKEAARQFRQEINLPLMLVGGIRSFEVAERLVTDGMADYISFGRPLIAEPDLIKRWQSGDRRKAVCISCNKCYEPLLAGKGLYCPVNEKRK